MPSQPSDEDTLPAPLAAHAAARRLLAQVGRPFSLASIARSQGLEVVRLHIPERAYFGHYLGWPRIALINSLHPSSVQRVALAEALMRDALPGHDDETIQRGTLHLLAPHLNWPTGRPGDAEPGTLVPVPRRGESRMIFETDAKFHTLYISPEFRRFLGFSDEQLRSAPLGKLTRPGENLRETEPDYVQACIDVAEGRRASHAAVQRMQTASGDEWLVAFHIHPHPRHTGGLLVSAAPLMQTVEVIGLDDLRIGRMLSAAPHLPRLTVGVAVSFAYAVADLVSDGRLDGTIRLGARMCAQAARAIAAR